jgi:hypothetical protein
VAATHKNASTSLRKELDFARSMAGRGSISQGGTDQRDEPAVERTE